MHGMTIVIIGFIAGMFVATVYGLYKYVLEKAI